MAAMAGHSSRMYFHAVAFTVSGVTASMRAKSSARGMRRPYVRSWRPISSDAALVLDRLMGRPRDALACLVSAAEATPREPSAGRAARTANYTDSARSAVEMRAIYWYAAAVLLARDAKPECADK